MSKVVRMCNHELTATLTRNMKGEIFSSLTRVETMATLGVPGVRTVSDMAIWPTNPCNIFS